MKGIAPVERGKGGVISLMKGNFREGRYVVFKGLFIGDGCPVGDDCAFFF